MEDRMCYITPDMQTRMRYFLRTRMLTWVISANIEKRIWRRTCIISPFMENHMCYFTIHGDAMIKFIPKCSYN